MPSLKAVLKSLTAPLIRFFKKHKLVKALFGWGLASLQDVGKEKVLGIISAFGLKVAAHIFGTLFLILYFIDQWKIAKKKGAKELLWIWVIVFLIMSASIIRSYTPLRTVVHDVRIAWLNFTTNQKPEWIKEQHKEAFLRSLREPLPQPPSKIIIALSGHNEEVQKGGKTIRELLERAYPGKVESGFRYDVVINVNPEYPSHRYVVLYHENTTTNSAVYLPAKELHERLSPYTSVSGSETREIKEDEICVYVQELTPPTK